MSIGDRRHVQLDFCLQVPSFVLFSATKPLFISVKCATSLFQILHFRCLVALSCHYR